MIIAQQPETNYHPNPGDPGMASLLSMPMEDLLTYQDLAAKLKCCTKTAADLLEGCPRLQPTRNTVRFLESDVHAFILKRWPKRLSTWPAPKPDTVKWTECPIST